MNGLSNYIKKLISRGNYFFSKEIALESLGISPNQFKYQAYRLAKKGIIKSLSQNFFMIVPTEYYNFGSLPPHWLIDAYMKHLKQDYYIGLLSAGSMYGATEQQPMTFQVITDKRTKTLKLKRGKIEFHYAKDCSLALKTELKVPTGFVKISTKEQTSVDLIKFYKVSGYLKNVISVIKNLAEGFDSQAFLHVISVEKNNTLQRLGYILELLKFYKLADVIEKELLKRKIKYIPFIPGSKVIKGNIKSIRWKLNLNDHEEFT